MKLRLSTLVALLALAGAAHAQVTVSEPWVRGTVAGQKATGAFMTLTSATEAKLVSASSPVAGVVEIHQMSMDGGVMRMGAVKGGLALPAGKAVELKPGGYHVMLMDLKQPVNAGETVPLSLVFEGADKKPQTVEVKATVRALGAQPAAKMQDMHDHKH
jgi:copper(I)-binding protein